MCGGVRQRRLAITDLRVDLGAEADADEAFPGAGAGNRRASIIGEGAGADDRRVANPSRMLVGQSAGAGGRGEMAARVAGARTDCAEGEHGRASCRESVGKYVSISVVAVSLHKKTNTR